MSKDTGRRLAFRKGTRGSRFRAIDRHGCAGLWGYGVMGLWVMG